MVSERANVQQCSAGTRLSASMSFRGQISWLSANMCKGCAYAPRIYLFEDMRYLHGCGFGYLLHCQSVWERRAYVHPISWYESASNNFRVGTSAAGKTTDHLPHWISFIESSSDFAAAADMGSWRLLVDVALPIPLVRARIVEISFM